MENIIWQPKEKRPVYLIWTKEKATLSFSPLITSLLPEILLRAPDAPLGSIAAIMTSVSGKCKQSSASLLLFLPEFSSKLEKDICGDTSGHYQKLLVILLQVDEGGLLPQRLMFPFLIMRVWWGHYKVMRGLGVGWRAAGKLMRAEYTTVGSSNVFWFTDRNVI